MAASLPSLHHATSWWDHFIPPRLAAEAETRRIARLHLRFGFLGLGFGLAYATFYALLDHFYGAVIILACSTVFGLIPLLLRRTANLQLTGHLFAAVLLAGFCGLGTVEGGLLGHAIGWLASVPLMVLLLLGVRPAMTWTALCVLAVSGFVLAHANEVHFPKTFPPRWEGLIDAAGYIGLVPFLAFLGSIFERTRALAFGQLQSALAELSEANTRLRKLNQDKDEFLNIAAHDLRNPLTGIVGYAGLLKMPGEPNPELVREAGGTIESLGLRMNAILTNLLDVRRIEEGRMEFKQEPCSADAIVSTVVRSFSQTAASKNITILWQPDPNAPAFLGDHDAAAQIFENLLSNAIKYSQPGSKVRCELIPDACGVRLNVVDNGPGLSEQDQRNLFKKFTRLAPKPTAGESSNGLGLWIVQKMARAMGGDVTCVSSLGKGSTFSLILPRAA